MDKLQKDVRDGVQAALLNSECSPQQAVEACLDALVEFAETELDAELPQLQNLLARVCWQRRGDPL